MKSGSEKANDLGEVIEQYCGQNQNSGFFDFKFHSIYTVLPSVLKYTEIIETSKMQIWSITPNIPVKMQRQ